MSVSVTSEKLNSSEIKTGANGDKKDTMEELRPIPDIREQVGDVEKMVLTFCLDPSKKENMRGIVEELLLHNSYLAGRLEQSAGKVKNKESAILSVVSKSLQASKRFEMAVKKTKAEPKQFSYAEKVKMTRNKVGQMVVKPPKNVVIIRLEGMDSEIKTSEDARDALFTLVNPRKKGIQDIAIRKISGNGLVVETTKPEGLKAFTENTKLKEAGLKTSTPQRRLPRMIMYDVPKEIPEKEILTCMKKQNLDRLKEEDVAAIKFCFRTGCKDLEETNWVIEVSPPGKGKTFNWKNFYILEWM